MMNTMMSRRSAIADEILRDLENYRVTRMYPSATRSCRMDLADAGDHYELKADLPGFSKEDLHIELNDNVLTLSGSFDHEDENKDINYLFRERRHESFSRRFDLDGIDSDNISAQFRDGVLTVTLPKLTEETEPVRTITIE